MSEIYLHIVARMADYMDACVSAQTGKTEEWLWKMYAGAMDGLHAQLLQVYTTRHADC